jgi:cob(I)alamin adenosyltransferase
MKIYTKTGDKGETGLLGGQRIAKDSDRIIALGELDELNAVLGVCKFRLEGISSFESGAPTDVYARVNKILDHLQKELIVLGADLANPLKSEEKIGTKNVDNLEKWIDEIAEELDPLREFILPTGHAAYFNLARTVCRRAERSLTRLAHTEKLGEHILQYINRLSDLLFVLGRLVEEKG